MSYNMIPVFLLSAMLIIMLMRIKLPIGAKVSGKRSKEVRLFFRERLLLQRVNIYAIGIVLLLTTVTGIVSRGWEFLVVLAVFSLLFMRVNYIFTREGIALNNVVYRSWTDFTGYEVRNRSIRLVPQPGMRPFDITVMGKHREQVVAVIRSHSLESLESSQPAFTRWIQVSGTRLKRLIRI